MKKHILYAGAAASLALVCAMPAAAQSIDYGSLEEMFGEPVTTSATGSPQRSTEAPADMQIISADEIRRSGETSIPGILQRAAGIDVMNHSAGQSDVNVRGYNQVSSPRLLVLVNGRQVYLDHYGMTMWATIPVQLEEIRQIEVVKGPNSALFGFNAVSGVVNIITYNPKFDDVDVASLRGGTGGQSGASLATTFKLGEAIFARVSGGVSKADEWKQTPGGPLASALHDPTRAAINLDVVAQLAPNVELRMEGSWSNTQQDSQVGGNSYAVIKAIVSSQKATLTADTGLGQIQAQAYQNQLGAKYGIAQGIDWDNKITVVSLQDLFKVGTAHTFRVGGEYRNNTLNVAPLGGADVSYDVLAASAMWNWQVNEKLATTVAMRVDRLSLERKGTFQPRVIQANNALWDREITEVSANLTAAWRPTTFDTVRLSYSRGVQAPSLIEFGGLMLRIAAGPGLNFDLTGNPFIEPTIVTNYELAYDHDFNPIKAKAGVRVFAQEWEDVKTGSSTAALTVLPTATTNGAFTYINGSDSKMKGVEVSASGRLSGNVGWRADYTWTDVKDSAFPGVNLGARNIDFKAMTPSGRGNVGLDYVKDAWEVDANLHFVGDYALASSSGAMLPVEGYASVSARVGYRLKDGLTLAVSGQNLLKERQKQVVGLEAERRLLFTITKAW